MGCGASAKKYEGGAKTAPGDAAAEEKPVEEAPKTLPPAPKLLPPLEEEKPPPAKKEKKEKVKRELTPKEKEKEARIAARVKAGGLADAVPCVCFHFRAEPDMPGMLMFGKYNDEDNCDWYPEVRLPSSIACTEQVTQLISFKAGDNGKDVFVGACFDSVGEVGRFFIGKYEGDGMCEWAEPAVPSWIEPKDFCTQAVALNFFEGGKDAFLCLYFTSEGSVGKMFCGMYNGDEGFCRWYEKEKAGLPSGVSEGDSMTQLVAFRAGQMGDQVFLGSYFDSASGGKMYIAKYEGSGVCRWFDEVIPPVSIDSSVQKCTQLVAFNSGTGGLDAGLCAYFKPESGAGKLFFGKYTGEGRCAWFEQVQVPQSVEEGDVCSKIIAFNVGEGGKEIAICAYFGSHLYFGKYSGEGSIAWCDERQSPSPRTTQKLYKEIKGPNGLKGYRCAGAAALQEIPIPGWND